MKSMSNQLEMLKDWLGAGSIDIFGRPFSGKDTQAEKLAGIFGGLVVSGGEILRSHHDPREVEEILNSGGIVPSDFYLKLVLPYLSRLAFADKPLILSAVGRSHGEEVDVIQAAEQSRHPIRAVILLDISEDEVWRRDGLSADRKERGQRADDTQKALELRLKKFEDQTMPVIDFYRNRDLLVEVDGSLPREAVTEEILAKLAELAKR